MFPGRCKSYVSQVASNPCNTEKQKFFQKLQHACNHEIEL